MQTTTQLHTLLRRFRDETGAQMCTVSSAEFGSRVEVGRPTTLTADDLIAGANGGQQAKERNLSRCLTATAAGYSVSAEFESEDAARDAQWHFAELLREVENLVSNPDPLL